MNLGNCITKLFWMDGLLMSSLYRLNSCKNWSVFPFLFWHCFFNFPAIRFSAGPKAPSNWPTAARQWGSVGSGKSLEILLEHWFGLFHLRINTRPSRHDFIAFMTIVMWHNCIFNANVERCIICFVFSMTLHLCMCVNVSFMKDCVYLKELIHLLLLSISLFKIGNPGLFFVYFLSFQTIYIVISVNFSRIRTWIVKWEGKYSDHHHHGPNFIKETKRLIDFPEPMLA